MDAFVGQSADLERGTGFAPPDVEPEVEPVYVAHPVVLLPRPEPFHEDGCMAAGVPWWHRLGRLRALSLCECGPRGRSRSDGAPHDQYIVYHQ